MTNIYPIKNNDGPADDQQEKLMFGQRDEDRYQYPHWCRVQQIIEQSRMDEDDRQGESQEEDEGTILKIKNEEPKNRKFRYDIKFVQGDDGRFKCPVCPKDYTKRRATRQHFLLVSNYIYFQKGHQLAY
ncbi:hypothetical protein BDA99DRAFT_535283 [Phascolomyces articulosus]|uniref:Uncharacterized protein n=1 Tax=Phascolomyces articulosus TaxID=60185 RepID=A0AAD5K4W3_9FUNG|nr:hypothetical protein BDA99DRAFT_535283 [Phascolomyces articulosus]